MPGADGRAPQGHDRPRRADVRQGPGQRRRGRRPRPGQRVVPHRRPGAEDRRGELPGRRLGRPARRPAARRPDAAAVAGTGHREVPRGRQLRQRVLVRLRAHAVVAERDHAAAAGGRTRGRCSTACSPTSPNDPEAAARNELRASVLDSVLRGRQGPEPQARRQRQAEARPVPDRRARAGEADRPRRAADAGRRCPTTSPARPACPPT